MKIALEFTYHTDIINVPEYIGINIRKYQRKFDKWLYDKDNDHGHWVLIDGKKKAVSFDTSVFVDYLNTYCLCDDEKVKIITENAETIPNDIKTIFF